MRRSEADKPAKCNCDNPRRQLAFEAEHQVVTTDCYGTLIDWEKGITDAFRKEADRDGLTIDERPFLERFFEIQAQIMSGSYELYA
jgi:2-haloacid dehalogenase/putative hydrolase of the HAD superfamily